MSKGTKDKNMVKQTEPQSKKGVNIGQAVGITLIVIGASLLLIALVSWISTFFAPMRVNKELPVPTLNSIVSDTNRNSIVIVGSVDPSIKVVHLFVNDKWIRDSISVNNDGTFSYEYNFDNGEGQYIFEAVSTKGALFRQMSIRSEKIITNVDWTAPNVDDISIIYPKKLETTDTFDISGNVEPGVTVILTKEDSGASYRAISADDGTFSLTDVKVLEGENVFALDLEDKAGNKSTYMQQIIITYNPISKSNTADSNVGVGKAGGELPESAGELSEALRSAFANKLSVLFGIVTWIMLIFAVWLNKKNEVTY